MAAYYVKYLVVCVRCTVQSETGDCYATKQIYLYSASVGEIKRLSIKVFWSSLRPVSLCTCSIVLSSPKHASEARCVPVIRCEKWRSLIRHSQADNNTAGFRNVGLGKTSMMESVRNPNDVYCHTQSSDASTFSPFCSYYLDGLG